MFACHIWLLTNNCMKITKNIKTVQYFKKTFLKRLKQFCPSTGSTDILCQNSCSKCRQNRSKSVWLLSGYCGHKLTHKSISKKMTLLRPYPPSPPWPAASQSLPLSVSTNAYSKRNNFLQPSSKHLVKNCMKLLLRSPLVALYLVSQVDDGAEWRPCLLTLRYSACRLSGDARYGRRRTYQLARGSRNIFTHKWSVCCPRSPVHGSDR